MEKEMVRDSRCCLDFHYLMGLFVKSMELMTEPMVEEVAMVFEILGNFVAEIVVAAE